MPGMTLLGSVPGNVSGISLGRCRSEGGVKKKRQQYLKMPGEITNRIMYAINSEHPRADGCEDVRVFIFILLIFLFFYVLFFFISSFFFSLLRLTCSLDRQLQRDPDREEYVMGRRCALVSDCLGIAASAQCD